MFPAFHSVGDNLKIKIEWQPETFASNRHAELYRKENNLDKIIWSENCQDELDSN